VPATAARRIEEDSDRSCGSKRPRNKELAGANTGGVKHASRVLTVPPRRRFAAVRRNRPADPLQLPRDSVRVAT